LLAHGLPQATEPITAKVAQGVASCLEPGLGIRRGIARHLVDYDERAAVTQWRDGRRRARRRGRREAVSALVRMMFHGQSVAFPQAGQPWMPPCHQPRGQRSTPRM